MATRDAAVTREKLLNAAHESLVEHPRGASVSEVCGRAGVNVAMVKYCFGSKDEMLDALLEQVLAGLTRDVERLAGLELEPEEKLRRHVAGIVRNYVGYPYINRLMTERLLAAEPDAVDRISRTFAIPARDFYATLLAEGRERSGWREVDPTHFFFSIVGSCEFLFSARALLERSFETPLDDDVVDAYADHVCEFVLRGVR